MFNIECLAAKDSVVLQLKHPVTEELLFTEAGEKVNAVLWGQSSKAYRTAVNAMQNRALKRGNKKATPEVSREEGVALLTACTQYFENLAYEGKVPTEPEDIRKFFNDARYIWAKDQVDAALGDISLFIEA